MTIIAKRRRQPWTMWYAWRPVITLAGKLRWLCWVQRRTVYSVYDVQHQYRREPMYYMHGGLWPERVYELVPDPSDVPPPDYTGDAPQDMMLKRRDGKEISDREYRRARPR